VNVRARRRTSVVTKANTKESAFPQTRRRIMADTMDHGGHYTDKNAQNREAGRRLAVGQQTTEREKGERDVRYPAARRVRRCAEWPLSFRLGF